MKIGIVSPYAYPRPGGANSYIREAYEQLTALGHDVRIVTAPWGDDPPAQDVIQIGQAIAHGAGREAQQQQQSQFFHDGYDSRFCFWFTLFSIPGFNPSRL